MHTNHPPSHDIHAQPLSDAVPYPAFLISLVYLRAGLPPGAAMRAAMADYEHGFYSWDLKLI